MAPAIEFKQVNKWFGKLHVLRDVTVRVEPGQVVVVCGPSGSGKSTLIRCVNRLEPIQSGEIVVNGLSLSDPALNPSRLRAEVGMVFQSFNLYPHMTALETITLAPVKVRKQSRQEAERIARDLLARLGSPRRPNSIRPSFPGASSSGWPSPRRRWTTSSGRST